MTPRPYQTRALDSVRAQFRAGKRACLVVAPTGSGKTLLGSLMAQGHVARGGRVVWLAHRKELREQGAIALRSLGLDVGHGGANSSAPVQVCSIQALLRRREVPEGTLVVADEAHHMAEGNGWTDLIRAYIGAKAWIVGLTATPARADGQALHGFDALVVAAQIRELVALGHLVPLKVRRPESFLRKDTIAQNPVDAYLELARGRSAVVFAPHVKAAEEYASGFRGLGVQCEVVTGKTPTDLRYDVLYQFATAALCVIINVGVLTEGWDAAICDCVILGRGCGSPGLMIQMVGRGLRPFDGKTDCLLIDLRGVTHLHGRPDADASYSLSGEGIVLKGAARGDRICKVCGIPLGDALVCPECGKTSELVTPKAVGAPLLSWDDAHDAVKERLNPRRDALTLAGLMRKNKSWPAVLAIFQRFFKRLPDDHCIAQAKAFNLHKDRMMSDSRRSGA
jgi:superfamily II DNA or RNA helicase